MKKLVIIACLVAALIGGLVGGTALAAGKPPTVPVVGPAIMMQTGGDVVRILAANDTMVAQPSYEGFVHVSLTVTVYYPLTTNMTGDYVNLVFVHADENGAKTLSNDEYYWIIPSADTTCGKATKTIEFDAAKAAADPYSWKLVAYNADEDDEEDAWAVAYTYTMTYPAGQ